MPQADSAPRAALELFRSGLRRLGALVLRRPATMAAIAIPIAIILGSLAGMAAGEAFGAATSGRIERLRTAGEASYPCRARPAGRSRIDCLEHRAGDPSERHAVTAGAP